MDATRCAAATGSVEAGPWLAFVEEELVNERREPTPTRGLLLESSQTGFRDDVVLRVTIVLGALPRAFDPALLFQSNQRGVQGPLVHRQRRFRDLLKASGQRIRMLRTHRRQGAEHNEIQGALEQFDAVGAFTGHSGGVSAAVSQSFNGLSS